jgi:predicted AlkP superfamily phosphohydrolase/phosphomutase
VLGFCEPHPAGHYLWPAGVDTVDHADEALFQPLFNIYAAIDRALGTLYDRLQDDTILMVVSGDGVRPNRCGWHLLPMVLERLGYTCPKSGGATGRHLTSIPSLLSVVKGLLPPQTKRWMLDRLPWRLRDRLGAQIQGAGIDWSQTRAATLPTDLEGCIRINLKGREPLGIVEPGAQYTDLCQEIRARLEELTNPANGARAVREVWIRDAVFPGERQEHLPDLVVSWNDGLPFEALASPRIGLVEGTNPDPRPGTHSPDSFLLAVGGRLPRGHQGTGHLMDVAPTVLELLGIEPPVGMDGRPLTALSPADL